MSVPSSSRSNTTAVLHRQNNEAESTKSSAVLVGLTRAEFTEAFRPPLLKRTTFHFSARAPSMDLNARVVEAIAVSTGRRSMEEAPTKPTASQRLRT